MRTDSPCFGGGRGRPRPGASLLLPNLVRLRSRLEPGGDLAGQGALLRHVVATGVEGSADLRQFHAMVWPSKSDDWPRWLRESLGRREIVEANPLMMDPWVGSSIVLRIAIHAAWAADGGALTRESLAAVMDRCLFVCERYVWPMFRGRAVAASPAARPIELSNQVSGLLAGMLYAGHVFGWRLARNRAARDLYLRARDAYPVLVGALDPEGYQCEGPTYQLHVEAPGLIFCAELLDAVEGGDHYRAEYPHPAGGRCRGSLAAFVATTVERLYLPSGLSLPLDDYGPDRPAAGFPLVHAARRTGERKFLDMLAGRGPYGPGQVLWHRDDMAWRLAFWPERVRGRPWSGAGSHALARHFGLLDLGGGTNLLQAWDMCAPLPHTHAHFNPNSITLDAHGTPVLVEGGWRSARAPYSREAGLRLVASHLEPFGDVFKYGPGDYRNVAALAPGAHNVVLVDGRDVARPRWDAAGRLTRFADGPVASLLASDATPIYESAGVALLEASRATIADKRARCFVVADEFASRRPRLFTWQAFARGSCRPAPGGAFAETREGVGLLIAAPADAGPFQMRRMPSYPAVFEGESTRLRRSARGRLVRFMHLLAPSLTREQFADITAGWRATLGEPLGAEPGSPEACAEASWRASLLRPAFLDCPDALGRWVAYRRAVRIPARLRGARLFLHLPLPAGRLHGNDAFVVFVNGVAFDPAPACESHFQNLDCVLDITDAVRFGARNKIEIRLISSASGGTRGRAFLTALLPGFARAEPRIAGQGARLRVLDRSRRMSAFAFGAGPAWTDAWAGLLGSDRQGRYGALFDFTRAALDKAAVRAGRPVSMQWDEKNLWFMVPRGESLVCVDGKAVISGARRLVAKALGRAVRVMTSDKERQ